MNLNTAHYANMKATLLKLKLMYESLTLKTQQNITKFIQKMRHSDFESLLLNIINSLNKEMPENKHKIDRKLNTAWMGVRYGVEVPNSKKSSERKNLGVEMLNRNFMWCDDYFHYEDWGHALREAYDGFNLWVKTPKDLKSDEKFYYQDGWRRAPKGIFPDGRGSRELSLPNVKDNYKKSFLSRLNLIKHKNFDGDITGKFLRLKFN